LVPGGQLVVVLKKGPEKKLRLSWNMEGSTKEKLFHQESSSKKKHRQLREVSRGCGRVLKEKPSQRKPRAGILTNGKESVNTRPPKGRAHSHMRGTCC